MGLRGGECVDSKDEGNAASVLSLRPPPRPLLSQLLYTGLSLFLSLSFLSLHTDTHTELCLLDAATHIRPSICNLQATDTHSSHTFSHSTRLLYAATARPAHCSASRFVIGSLLAPPLSRSPLQKEPQLVAGLPPEVASITMLVPPRSVFPPSCQFVLSCRLTQWALLSALLVLCRLGLDAEKCPNNQGFQAPLQSPVFEHRWQRPSGQDSPTTGQHNGNGGKQTTLSDRLGK